MGFRLGNLMGRAVMVSGDAEHYYDLAEVSAGGVVSDPMYAIEYADILTQINNRLDRAVPSGKLADVTLEAPIPRPGNCYAIGLNYRKHAEESGMAIPTVPMVFTKHSNSINGPGGEIHMRSDYVDYEVELVAVIGIPGKHISVENAWNYVVGLCIGQDVSDRAVQFSSTPPQFNLGKSFDTFAPLGPVLTSPDRFEDKNSLELRCEVNGELRQQGNTNDLIFDIPTLVSYLSGIVTLKPGDLIFTGTPAGVGMVDGKYLRDGDLVTSSIQGLGSLCNRCVRNSDHPHAKYLSDTYKNTLHALQKQH